MESMKSLSQGSGERARKFESLILHRLSSVGQCAVALDLETSESTISRMKKDGDIARFAKLVECLGLKVVPADMKCFNPKDIDAILHQAKNWLQHVESAEQLWEYE